MLILANTITADMSLIPDFALIGPLCGLPLSVMAAVIERPFLTAAGLKRHAVWYSIQANFVSLLLGYPLVCRIAALSGPGGALLPLRPFAAVLLSTAVELAYLQPHFDHRPTRASFRWFLAANGVSAAICLSLLFLVYALDRPELKAALRPYQVTLSIVLGLFRAVAVVMAFVVPRRARRSPPPVAQPA